MSIFNSDKEQSPIAIVGMGCRFPGGADSPSAFWELLKNGVDGIVDVPKDRWDSRRFYDPDPRKEGKMYIRQGGFLQDKLGYFDADFFGISPREAVHMDPQQTLLLEVVWEAFADAGLPVEQVKGSNTGVYMGCFTLDYQVLQFRVANRHLMKPNTASGVAMCLTANRISHLFDLHGPSIAIDTACSSSLVALHYACQGLREGECDIAVAGGVNVMMVPEYPIAMCKGQFLSPDARCKTFDREANGYARGEGAGIVVLKPLAKALADHDSIYALIRGTGINQDGATPGISYPNGDSQEKLLRKVYGQAGINPEKVQYVEAHGTGTQAGDVVEATVLGNVLGKKHLHGQELIVGSVKTNFGHLEAAAGVAGIIKTALCLKYKAIPQNLHFKNPNPKISFHTLGIKVPCAYQPWPETMGPAIAGVNSFGYGGTNAHTVMMEYIPKQGGIHEEGEIQDGPLLFPLSSITSARLSAMARQYVDFLDDGLIDSKVSLYDLCYSASVRRSHLEHRLVVLASSKLELKEKLQDFAAGIWGDHVFVRHAEKKQDHKLLFAYSGMGSQWWGMGRELFSREPLFKATFIECDTIFQQYAGWSLIDELLKDEESSNMAEVRVAQPLNFAFQVAMTALLKSWGIVPDGVIGHSVGEIVAFYIAGVLSLQDALLVSYHGSRIQQQLSQQGTMLAAYLSHENAAQLIKKLASKVVIAAINSPNSVSFSGSPAELEEIATVLSKDEISYRFINVNIAYHSNQLESLQEEVLAALQGIAPGIPVLPLYSTVTGRLVKNECADAQYWWKNIRQTVLFGTAVENAIKDGYRFFLEISAQSVLSGYIAEELLAKGVKGHVLFTQKRGADAKSRLLAAVALLHVSGYPVQWDKIYLPNAEFVKLPHHLWQREFYFNESEECREERLGPQGHPLLGTRLKVPKITYQNELNNLFVPYLGDHKVKDSVVLPGACYVEVGLALHKATQGEGGVVLEDLEFHNPLIINQGKEPLLHSEYDFSAGTYAVYSSLKYDQSVWTLHATGKVSRVQEENGGNPINLELLRCTCSREVHIPTLYRHLMYRGLSYGPAFQNIKRLWKGSQEVFMELECNSLFMEEQEYLLHPVLLDASFQAMIAAMDEVTNWYESFNTYVPIKIRKIIFYKKPPHRVYGYGKIIKSNEQEIESTIVLFDEQGDTYARIEGLCCKTMIFPRLEWNLKLQQCLYQFAWYEEEPTTSLSPQGGTSSTWLLLTEDKDDSKELSRELTDHNIKTINIIFGKDFNELADGQITIRKNCLADFQYVMNVVEHMAGIIYLGTRGNTSQRSLNFFEDQVVDYMDIVHMMQSLRKEKTDKNLKLLLVTKGGQTVTGHDEPISPFQSSLWGLGRVIVNEYPWITTSLVDLDPSIPELPITQLVDYCSKNQKMAERAFRGTKTFVGRLVAYPEMEERHQEKYKQFDNQQGTNITSIGEGTLALDPHSTYLVTGGLGGLGLETARWLAGHGARHIVLAGRSNLLSPTAAYIISALTEKNINVEICQVDVSCEEQVKGMIHHINTTPFPLKGVIHGAGTLSDSYIEELTIEKFAKVMAPKGLGALNLHLHTANLKLDFFVIFSSISSMIGNPGQGNYATANAFAQGVAQLRWSYGLPALYINLGVVADVGMAAKSPEILRSLESVGVKSISPVLALNALAYMLCKKITHGVFADINWQRWAEFNPQLKDSLKFSHLVGKRKQEDGGEKAQLFKDQLELLGEAERYGLTEALVMEMVSVIMDIPLARININKHLKDMGLDSLMAIEITIYVQMNFGVVLPVMEIFKDINIINMTNAILERIPGHKSGQECIKTTFL